MPAHDPKYHGTQSKRHHYVPQWLQANFAAEDSLPGKPMAWIYDKDQPTDPPRLQSAINTGVIGHLYTLEAKDGTSDSSLEDAFQQLEGFVQPTLRRWQASGAKATDEDALQTAEFVASMLVRVPRTLNAMKEVTDASHLRALKEFVEESPEELHGILQKLGAEGEIENDGSLEEAKKLFENVEERIVVDSHPSEVLINALSQIEAIASILLTMNWCLCRSASGSFYVTSDCPVNVFLPTGDGTVILGGGLAMPGVQVALPISPDVCLFLDRKTNQRSRRASHKFVGDINRRMIAMAERYVISHKDTSTIRRTVQNWAHTRGQPKMDKDYLINRRRARKRNKT